MAYLIAHEAAHGALREQDNAYPIEEAILQAEGKRCDFGCCLE